MSRIEDDPHRTRLRVLIAVIVPTYNEAEAVPILVSRLAKSLANRHWELIIVDDGSPDGTADIAERLAMELPIRVLRRSSKAGLASAVIAGFGHTPADVLVVMDADLSHPPEVVPLLVDAIDAGADLAVGSRYIAGGKIEDWPLKRRVVSRVACLAGSFLVPIHDATSGFFAVRRSAIDDVALDGIGFKIGFEIFAKANYRRAKEVPYVFTDRAHGSSKFGGAEMRAYAVQLRRAALARLRHGARNAGGAAR